MFKDGLLYSEAAASAWLVVIDNGESIKRISRPSLEVFDVESSRCSIEETPANMSSDSLFDKLINDSVVGPE